MLIRSLLTEQNPFNSTEEILEWIRKRNNEVGVSVEPIPFEKMDKWYSEEDGSLHHESGRFFSICGIDVVADHYRKLHWQQPIIFQPEIGYLGILTKEFGGVLYFLMQAKIEPGNVNCVQVSPTLQATKSNYTRIHEGNRPNYLEYFLNAKPHEIIVDQLQSEQGARFMRKRNRNIIIKVNADIPVLPDYKWMTLGQIKKLMTKDNTVNMDTRTVLSGLKTSDFVSPFANLDGLSKFGSDLLLSSKTNHSLYTTQNLLSWLTSLKSKFDLNVERCPIIGMDGWQKTENEISRPDLKYFKVIGVKVRIENREVKTWCQPLIQPMQEGLCAYIVKKIDGVYHFLVQAKMECGNFDILELAPTVQCLTGNVYSGDVKPPFADYVLNARPEQIIFDTLQSEEGGRFFKEQNRNLIVVADDGFDMNLPENYTWMTLKQIYKFLRFNNYLNIQSRSLLSTLSYM